MKQSMEPICVTAIQVFKEFESLKSRTSHFSTLDAKTQSDETLKVSILFKRQMRDLSSKIGIDVQPIYTSKKLEQDLKLKEIKPRIVNQHSVVYCVKCALCDSNYVGDTTHHLFHCIADHRYSAVGRHLRVASLECLKNEINGIVLFVKCCA